MKGLPTSNPDFPGKCIISACAEEMGLPDDCYELRILRGFARLTVRSTTETSRVGTRMAIPVSLPQESGILTMWRNL